MNLYFTDLKYNPFSQNRLFCSRELNNLNNEATILDDVLIKGNSVEEAVTS